METLRLPDPKSIKGYVAARHFGAPLQLKRDI